MKNNFFNYLLIFFIFFIFSSPVHAITTTSTVNGEDIVWSISGISDGQIKFLSKYDSGSGLEIFTYTAPLKKNMTIKVNVNIPHAAQLIDNIAASRFLEVSIPDAGTRWVAQKDWSSGGDGWPSPASVSLEHQAKFSAYQCDPAYPDPNLQADKHIQIRDDTWTYANAWRDTYIVIVPLELIGLSNDEENGLPRHARTEPDFKRKKPYGCNSCSAIGLPGYRVNMFNLRPVIQDPLFQWGSRGPAVQLTLTWNAGLDSGYTNFGTGWRFSYDAWLEESSSGVTIQQDTGGQLHFDTPYSGNANVVSVVPGSGDTAVLMEYSAPVGTTNYTSGWDGKFMPHPDGYHLEKTIGGDPDLRTFTFTSPDKKISYIFEGPSDTSGPVPLVALEDWNGNRVQITRNGSGAITRITDAVNRSATLTYNQAGQCTLLTVPGGGQIHFSYSGGEMAQSIDLIGNETNYTYNSENFLTSMITEGRPWLFTWSNSYNHDYVSSVTDPEGAVTHYSINYLIQNLYQTQVTDSTDRTFVYNYPSGHYSDSDRPQSTKVVPDTQGRPVTIYQNGTTTNPRTLEYDDNSNITKMTDYNGGVHTYTYNDHNQVTQYVDALNNTWSSVYDSHGNKTQVQSPAGRVYQSAYNAQGELIQEIDPEGNTISYSYDSFGNLKTVTDGEGSVTTYIYDSQGINLIGITDPLGNTTSFTYDANRRLIRTTHPDGTFREKSYDCCAQTGIRNENGDIRTVTRNPSLKVTRESDFLGNITVNTYDAAGRMITSRDPQGRTIRTSYNALGLAESVQNALGGSVSWTYGPTDTPYSHQLCQDPPAEASIYPSLFGVPAKANGWQYVRDKMGRLSSIFTPRDKWKGINYSRDTDGLLTGIDVDGSSVATFVRDGNGMLTATTHALGTDSYIRNGRGQATQQTWYDGKTAVFGYDGAGRLHSVIYPDGSVALYSYDSRGRITNISWKGQTFATQYDAVGNIVKETRSNGITTAIENDKNGMPLRIHNYAGSQNYLDLQGQRNTGGMLTRIQQSGDILTWVPPLTTETTHSSFTYGHSFTLASRNGQTATTDPAGNQTTIPGSRSFSGTYNFFDLLTDWTASGNSNSAVYDGQRRLLQWNRNGETRKFHYDERGRLLFATNGANVITASWLYRENQVVAMADSNGVYFYHNDLSGNISFLSDASGTVAAHYRYLPFGRQASSVSSVDNPFTFVGSFGVIDLQDGLYYMGSRTYDAIIRAFLSNDPIGMGVTVNAREYAANNPINLIDPDGRSGMRFDYSLDGVQKPWHDPELDHKLEYFSRGSGSSGEGVDPCKIGDTILNTAGTTRDYGKSAAVLTVLNDLRQGNYGDAVYDTAGGLAGAANPYVGAFTNFMKAKKMGNGELPQKERQYLEELGKRNWFNRKESPSYGDFTVPPFSLDD